MGFALVKDEPTTPPFPASPPLLATLVQTHTGERLALDEESPAEPRFDALLADRVTGQSVALDPRLLGLLRKLAIVFRPPGGPPPRVELVSGFRSPKLNEMMRKKGHHVASHSQHSLGHAVDFRIVVPCGGDRAKSPECAGLDAAGLDPREVEREVRREGWDGGVGVYTGKDDWFVHADVGPERGWHEGPP
jgi:uncharacterized protein YcbK (DUF882 family)